MKKLFKFAAALLLVFAMLMPSFTVSAFAVGSSAKQAQMLNYTSIKIAIGQKVQIKANTNKTVKWGTSNKSVVKISSKGYITGVSIGSAKIRAVVGGKNYYCKVEVVTPAFKGGDIIELEKGKTAKLSLGITTGIKWHSTNPYVVTVNSSGTVKAVRRGTGYIVAAVGGKEYMCTVITVDMEKSGARGFKDIVDAYDYYPLNFKAIVCPEECDKTLWETPSLKGYIMNYAALSNSELHEGNNNYIYQVGDKYGNFTITEATTTFVDVDSASKRYTDRDYIIYFSRIRAKGKATFNCSIGYIDDGPEAGEFYLNGFVDEIISENKFPITQDIDGAFINLDLTQEQQELILSKRSPGGYVNCAITVSECATGTSQAPWDCGSKYGRLILTVSDVKYLGY